MVTDGARRGTIVSRSQWRQTLNFVVFLETREVASISPFDRKKTKFGFDLPPSPSELLLEMVVVKVSKEKKTSGDR
jgi:hypothetical protein